MEPLHSPCNPPDVLSGSTSLAAASPASSSKDEASPGRGSVLRRFVWPGRVLRLCWASAEAGAQSAAGGGARAPAPAPRCACCCWATYAPCSCGCTWSNATMSGCSASVASCSQQLQQAHGSCCRSCQTMWLAGGRSCMAWPLRGAAAPANQCTLLTLPSILALKPACKQQSASRSDTAGGIACEVQAPDSDPKQRTANRSFK